MTATRERGHVDDDRERDQRDTEEQAAERLEEAAERAERAAERIEKAAKEASDSALGYEAIGGTDDIPPGPVEEEE